LVNPSVVTRDWSSAMSNLAPEPAKDIDPKVISDIVTMIVKWTVDHDLPAPTDIDQTFADAGYDSIQSVELAFFLEDQLKVQVDDTVLYTCPTFSALARYLAERTKTSVSAEPVSGATTDGAVTGSAGW
jgi:acyl carrier protein